MPAPETRPAHVLDPGSRLAVRREGGGELTFEVLAPLEEGGGSRTYLARGEGERYAVLKATRWLDAPDTPLVIEERILAQLDHPNVVRFLGSGRDAQGKLVLASERAFLNPLLILARPSIRAHFPDDPGTRFYPLPPPVALRLALDLFRGLEHLHGQGFVHHDVKLSNLMVRVPLRGAAPPEHEVLGQALEGRARGILIDVGGSRSADYLDELNRGEADADVSVVPPQLTPLYAPPEALLENDTPWGRRRLLLPSLDLYAAAIVVYSCLTGRAPYDHFNEDTSDLQRLFSLKDREQAGRLTPFSRRDLTSRRDVPQADELFGFLSSCVAREPDRRPAIRDARQFLQKLQVQTARSSERLPRRAPRPRPQGGAPLERPWRPRGQG